MRDEDCVEFLQWSLPRLHLRWLGFRKVRRQVCRRVGRRVRELGLAGVDEYRAYLEANEAEWRRLDELCHVTISRFFRDRGVFGFLKVDVLPALAQSARARGGPVRAWSAGCASGEEAYALVIVWELAVAPVVGGELRVLATDVDEAMLRRARAAEYRPSSLRELPPRWRDVAFEHRDDAYTVRPAFRRPVTVRRHDVRDPAPRTSFDLILCRNVAFTYFDLPLQRTVAARLAERLRPGGALVLGSHETLPSGVSGLTPWSETHRVYRRAAPGASSARSF